MKQKFIPVEESFKQWKKDPKYVAAYEALEAEFSLASALIKARADAEAKRLAEEKAKAKAVAAAKPAKPPGFLKRLMERAQKPLGR